MALPSLILAGDVTKKVITDIALSYEVGVSGPTDLTRVKYDVRRETRTLSSSGSTNARVPVDYDYDHVRTRSILIAYADVLTESLLTNSSSSTANILTVDLINEAVFMTKTAGVTFNSRHFALADKGAGNTSQGTSNLVAYEPAPTWYIGPKDLADPGLIVGVTYWFIRNIGIIDNQNSTSRVTFHFEYVTPWEKLSDIAGAI